MAIKMTTGGNQPPPTVDLDGIAKAQIGASRSQILAEMLQRISTGEERLPGSNLEGISRVVNAGIGAYHQNQAANQELAQRRAMIEALGGASGLDPLEAAMFAGGDRAAINTILQGRLSDRRLAESRAYEAKMLADQRAREDARRAEDRQLSLSDKEADNAFELQKLREKAQLDAQEEALKGQKNTAAPNRLEFEHMSELAKQAKTITDLASRFKDSYGGYTSATVPLVGNLRLEASRITGNKRDQDAAQYWADYSTYRNQLRHSLFGSALTEAERKAFAESDVYEGQSPTYIKRRLASLAAIAENVRRREAMKYVQGMGYDPNRVAVIFGIKPDDIGKEVDWETDWTATSAERDMAKNAQAKAASTQQGQAAATRGGSSASSGTFKPAMKPEAAPAAPAATAEPSAAAPTASAPRATGPNGEVLELQNGQWVRVK